MTKNQFLEKLEKLLALLPYDERRDILYNYDEHFTEKNKLGVNEEEIAAALGDPELIAKKYLAELPAMPKNEKNRDTHNYTENMRPYPQEPLGNSTSSQVLLTVLFVFLNLIFVLPTYMGIVIFIITALFTTVVLIIAGLVLLISIIVGSPVMAISMPMSFIQYPLLGAAGSISLISISGLLLIAFSYMLKYIIQFTGIYVNWMAKVVRGY